MLRRFGCAADEVQSRLAGFFGLRLRSGHTSLRDPMFRDQIDEVLP
jgi:hypothetical protein